MADLRQRAPRLINPAYLAWLRLKPCACGCGSPQPSDAAHIRSGSVHYGKEYPGLQRKPDDHWAVPLLHAHHMDQHAFGDELLWWSKHGKDPFYLAMRYNALYKAETGRDAIGKPARSRLAEGVQKSSGRKTPKGRPKPKRSPATPARPARHKQKIASRPFAKGKRPFRRAK